MKNMGLLGLLFLTALASPMAVAQDWSSCASDLDSLRRRASDASSAANAADSAKEAVESAKGDYEQCMSNRRNDPLRSGCSSQRSDYDSAVGSYKNELSSLESALNDVDSKVRASSSSCGFELQRVLGPPPVVPEGVTNAAACAVYLPYRGRLPLASLLSLCSKQMSEGECRKCLGTP